MLTIIKTRNYSLSEALLIHAERRLRFALIYFQSYVHSVKMRLSEINGAKDGENKRCHLHIVLDDLPDVIAENTESNMYVAIDSALQKASRSVKRTIDRHQPLLSKSGNSHYSVDVQE